MMLARLVAARGTGVKATEAAGAVGHGSGAPVSRFLQVCAAGGGGEGSTVDIARKLAFAGWDQQVY